MTPPLFLVPDVRAGRCTVAGEEGHHAAAVRRLRPGERVDVTDGRGTLGRAEVVALARSEVTLDVVEVRTEPAPGPRVTVAQALLKGDAGERAVGLLTQVGVDRILPWAAERAVARWDRERTVRGVRRWRAAAREAAKQAHRVHFPELVEPTTAGGVAAAVRTVDWAGCLHPDASARLAQAQPPPSCAEVMLVVGPEGGLTEREVDELAAAGAQPYRMGPEVLRAEAAGMAATAVLHGRTGRW